MTTDGQGTIEAALVAAIRSLVLDLACERYAQLEADGRAGRLSAEEIRTAVVEYGRDILPLPDDARPLIHVYPHDGYRDRCSVDVPMWTAQEGRSDLTLSITATRERQGYRVEIDNLHVL